MNHNLKLVQVVRFELTTSCAQGTCASHAALHLENTKPCGDYLITPKHSALSIIQSSASRRQLSCGVMGKSQLPLVDRLIDLATKCTLPTQAHGN